MRKYELCDYLRKYYSICNDFYSTRLIQETNIVNPDVFSFYNLCVSLENMHPLLKTIFVNYSNSFINICKNLSYIDNFHYVPVNSDKQFFNYLKLDNYNTQIYPLVNLISRFVLYKPYDLKQIFNKKDEKGQHSTRNN